MIINPAHELALLQKSVSNFDPNKKPKYYLDTGDAELNNIFGHPIKGIPYGKCIEISGKNQSGKSAIALDLLSLAQDDGAFGVWDDAENSFEAEWAATRGVDVNRLAVLSPYVGEFTTLAGKKKGKTEERIITAEEQCQQVQDHIQNIYNKSKGKAKFFLVVDSTTALLAAEEADAGIAGQNARTKNSQAHFMSQLCRRWVGFAHATNTIIFFINQIRINPMQMFGNPEYTPGGEALKFYCHVRVQARRVKHGRMMHAGHQIGIKGYLRNVKNKCGGLEFSELGYKIQFRGSPAYTSFMSMKAVKKED